MSERQVLLAFLLYPLAQYLVGSALSLSPWFAFEPYIAFWLLLPYGWQKELTLLCALGFGFVMDIAFPPYGQHTFSGLWVWALRGLWTRILFPLRSPDEVVRPETFSLGDWVLYAFPLSYIYFVSYHALESLRWEVLLRALLSAGYSFLGVWVIFAVFIRRSYAR
jgi:hypothetical protein